MTISRARSTAAVAAVLLVSACSGDPGATAPATDSATGPATASSSGTSDPTGSSTPPPPTATTPGAASTAAVLDPAYAVAAPGKRRGPLGAADILISAKQTLSPELVARLRDLQGVTAVTTISLANVPLENKVYNLAAVDPAQYRRFTSQESADLQAQWDRVAAGEVAVSDDLRKRLPVTKQGVLTLGQEAGADVHVGAWAPQAEKIDMVVNRKRGAALGMVADNAMLISTGQTAPESLRKPIARLVGDTAVVQNLDAVARYGLDPGKFDSAVLVGDFADAVGVFDYTPTGGGRITPDPSWVRSHIVTETVPILGSVTCNKYLMPQLKAALAEVVQLGLASTINPDQYAGCYYPRFIAGSTTLSNHSFGLALDLNTPGNQRGTVGEMDRGVVAVFKRWGFAWGGDWRYTDPMHFELSKIVTPG
ncbi:M15 family metallopeptidase [Nocardioides plantarum]|uniref:M15 family metallopeptidase n=1 Tax=Nocardioides plantarum TaxID=29299 RepID=A0ABV5KFC7_9ACTN|nr:M15 family metallopeptidase [Nocardioides plantarum]